LSSPPPAASRRTSSRRGAGAWGRLQECARVSQDSVHMCREAAMSVRGLTRARASLPAPASSSLRSPAQRSHAQPARGSASHRSRLLQQQAAPPRLWLRPEAPAPGARGPGLQPRPRTDGGRGRAVPGAHLLRRLPSARRRPAHEGPESRRQHAGAAAARPRAPGSWPPPPAARCASS